MFNVVATELKMICNKGLCSSHLKWFCNSRYSRSKNYLPPFFLHLSQSPFVIFLPYIGFLRTKKFFSLEALAICFSLPLNSSWIFYRTLKGNVKNTTIFVLNIVIARWKLMKDLLFFNYNGTVFLSCKFCSLLTAVASKTRDSIPLKSLKIIIYLQVATFLSV